MTSQLLKNRQITPVNTHQWNCLEFLLLFSSLAVMQQEVAFAETPSLTAIPAKTESLNQRTAAERWRRLNSLYRSPEKLPETLNSPGHEAGVTRGGHGLPSKPDRSPAAAAVKQSESNQRSIENNSPTDSNLELGAGLSNPQPSSPFTNQEGEAAWIVPLPIDPEAGSKTSDTLPSTQTVTSHESPVIPPTSIGARDDSNLRTAFNNQNDLQNSASVPASRTPIAPVRYREMSSINPFIERGTEGQEIDHDIREWAKEKSTELNIAFGLNSFPDRSFPAVLMPWDAPNFFYYPLYFEDPALERYGHTYHPLIQPLASISRFSGQLVALPYQMTLDPPAREVSSLGWYRPGECAPNLHYQVPLNAKAAAVEVATITGLAFLIP